MDAFEEAIDQEAGLKVLAQMLEYVNAGIGEVFVDKPPFDIPLYKALANDINIEVRGYCSCCGDPISAPAFAYCDEIMIEPTDDGAFRFEIGEGGVHTSCGMRD
jgi:hypothetical protein